MEHIVVYCRRYVSIAPLRDEDKRWIGYILFLGIALDWFLFFKYPEMKTRKRHAIAGIVTAVIMFIIMLVRLIFF